jgi:hypothetical protein
LEKLDDGSDDEDNFNGESSELSTRISEIKEKLEKKELNKNQKKNLRRKLKKYEDRLSESSLLKPQKSEIKQ